MSTQADASRRTRRYIFGGLLAASAVAIALALIFTVGGVGQKKSVDSSTSSSSVASLADDKNKASSGLDSVLDR